MDSLFPEFDNRKVCLKCNTPKPLKAFPGRHLGYNDWCRACVRDATQSAPEGMKFCTRCKETLEISDFPTSMVYGKMHMSSWCAQCKIKYGVDHFKRTHTFEESRDKSLRSLYGITLEDYNRMLEEQGGVCAICKGDESFIHWRSKKKYPLIVDHCHMTGAVRGILCNGCNHALGLLQENPDRARALLQYIEERCLW